MSTFPDMVFELGGAPVSGGRFSSPWATHYFVDGENGDDSNSGLKPTDPLDTIQAAVTKAVGGDVIYIRPQNYTIDTGFTRYTEDVAVTLGGAGGAGVDATNADISIIGITNSPNPEYGVRWKFATTQCLLNDAPALHLENIGFFAESATYAIYLRNNGATKTQRGSDGTTIYNCVIKGAALYVASGGDGLHVRNCTFHTAYGGGTGGYGGIYYTCSASPGYRLRVQGCLFYGGNVTEQPTSTWITLAPSMTVATIADNIFQKIPATNVYINATGSANTGIICGNYFADADVSSTELVVGGMVQCGNYDTAGLVAL